MKTPLMTAVAAATLGLVFAMVGTSAPVAHAAEPFFVPPPPVWSWTGPYVGLHAGAVGTDVEGELSLEPFGGDPGQTLPLSSGDVFSDNVMIGGQAGYNYQIRSIVLGLEGDIGFGDVKDDIEDINLFQIAQGAQLEAGIDWMATIRGRLGYVWDRTLLFVTAGLALTKLEVEFQAPEIGTLLSDTQSMFGWTVGGGVEHAFTDSLSFKAEYLFADFGDEDFSVSPGGDDITFGRFDLKTHTFRVGVNWLF